MIHPTRHEAGRRLCDALEAYRDRDPVVIAFTPGGLRVAYEIATGLAAGLDYLAARKVKIPGQRRSLVGAVTPRACVLDRESVAELAVPDSYLDMLIEEKQAEVSWEATRFRGGLPPIPLKGRWVIVADDGMADPLQVEAIVDTVREAGAASVVFATPACSTRMDQLIAPNVERVVALSEPAEGRSFVVCDERFAQTTAADARQLIESARRLQRAPRGAWISPVGVLP